MFAHTVRMTDVTWPLGPVLREAREALGLSKREAAKRAGLSDNLWRRLEDGYYMVQGERVPLRGRVGELRGVRPETLRAAALAVKLDLAEAAQLVGYPAEALAPQVDPVADAVREAQALYRQLVATYGESVAKTAVLRWSKTLRSARNDAGHTTDSVDGEEAI